MNITKYLECLRIIPENDRHLFSLGSSHADAVAYFKHEISGMTIEQLRKVYLRSYRTPSAQIWLMRTHCTGARCLRHQMF